jgi:hypothetical protein
VLDESAIARIALVGNNDSIERCLFRTVPGKANVNGHFSSSTSGWPAPASGGAGR